MTKLTQNSIGDTSYQKILILNF